MVITKLIEQLPGAGVGFVIGAFTPSIGRKIKALFVKETTKAKIAVETEVKAVEKKL
jgi:hypothetical protein